MRSTKILLLVVIVLLAGLCAFLFFSKNSTQKIAFIELDKIYLNFQMKKELEAKLKNIQQKRNDVLDSLKLELKVLSNRIETNNGKNKDDIAVFSAKRDNFYEKQKQFEEENVNTAKLFDGQIFGQINQYVKDYGTKNDYLLILGAEGSGVLMFAKEAINITEEIKIYTNERYKGQAN